MTALRIHQRRSHLAQMNAIGEICAQVRSGLPATIRQMGAAKAKSFVEAYQCSILTPRKTAWKEDALDRLA